MSRSHPPVLALAAVVLAAGVGCSFSYSSRSISDSSKHSSDSSSSSSKNDKTAFSEDVVEYAKAYVEAGGGAGDFLGGVGELARKRGISDWESDDANWVSIGRGIGMTKASEPQLEAYERAWTSGDSRRIASIKQGVDAVR
jgi:hypothetical protein